MPVGNSFREHYFVLRVLNLNDKLSLIINKFEGKLYGK